MDNKNNAETLRTELRDAIWDGELPRVREIIEAHPELINMPSSDYGSTPLLDAVGSSERTVELVAYLLELGADVRVSTREGYTALHCAMDVNGETNSGTIPGEIIRILIRAGADLEARQHWGWTPLMCAILEGGPEVVQALCDAGACVDVIFPDYTLPECKRGDTLLMASVYDPDIIRILLAAGADPYQKGLYGMDAIERAAEELRKPKTQHDTGIEEAYLQSLQDLFPSIEDARVVLGADFMERSLQEMRQAASSMDFDNDLTESLRLLTAKTKTLLE